MRPVTYSIASFNTLRCLEQIKIDVCYHKLPVIIVGVGAGLSYAELGPTHQSCEDIGLLSSFPGMHVVCPADAVEVRLALRAAVELGKPVYLRLGKKNEAVIHEKEPEFYIGKSIMVKQGTGICLLSTGNILPVAAQVADGLEKKGVNSSLVSMHTVKPLDNAFLSRAFAEYRWVVTLEEHSLIGGLGSAVDRWLGENYPDGLSKLIKFGCRDQFVNLSHRQLEARKLSGLTAEIILEKLYQKWQE
jgi:transketolase